MRNYGANKSTEFTKKQISVIYRLAKEGTLKVQKGEIADLYDLADYYGYDDNGSVEDSEGYVLLILEAVFSKDYEKAQKLIDQQTERTYNNLSVKRQQKWNSELL